jgi:hypothetical protein
MAAGNAVRQMPIESRMVTQPAITYFPIGRID